MQVDYTDPNCIKAAIEELGYPVEVHEIAQNLEGYRGDRRTQSAEIIVRRKHVGSAANDVGFKKKADGKYELIISEYDRCGKTGQNFMEKMKQLYTKHKTVQQLKRMNKNITSIQTLEDGRIRIRAMG